MAVSVEKLKIRTLSSSRTAPKGATAKFLPKFEKVEKELATVVSLAPSDNKKWKDLKDDINVVNEVTTPATAPAILPRSKSDILEDDGSLYLFWIDAYEKSGTIYLFGKVLQKTTGNYISCCVSVYGVERNLFVLPRTHVLDAQGNETEQAVTMGDVYQEFDQVRKSFKVSSFMSKPVSRKYAFELPNIPAESDYLKVLYSYAEPELPSNLTGKTFSHVFGTRTSALELFLLKRKLMGPSWVKVCNVEPSPKNFVVRDPKKVACVNYDTEPSAPKASPPLVVMSLNMRTIMNHAKNINEIVSISALVYNKVNVDSETTDLSGTRFTIIRQHTDVPWPAGFLEAVKGHSTKVDVLPHEKALLNCLVANLQKFDPDVIVGHNVIDFDLDVLLQRMKSHKVDFWSRIGRLRRTVWPKLQSGAGGTGDSTYAERQIATGRLLCDTYRAAKDLINAKSNSLTYLSATQLKIDRADIEYEKISSYFWEKDLLLEMIQHCEFDTFLVTQLMFKFQVLQLTKQLTNLAGNLWSRTMVGARAERNEFLLLHEFHEKKYICPDKVAFGSNQVNTQLEELDDEAQGPSQPKGKGPARRKAAYAGGLVLEPKKGLYDKYVLMLDFNSLYPSIIQEYNICFTTVQRTYDSLGDHLPEVPDTELQRGILPKLLYTLVDRRRAVKALLKDPKITPQEYAQYDIRQKALKLTANSMYGCLGFVHSRFFAKPIAMLITSKGREILQNTVSLAEQSNLEVIYGDTDSIMIHTNTMDLAVVKKIGQDLKQAVNSRYKLLEIEMDGFYQRMLLLKKKKYAAIIVEEKNGQLSTSLESKGLDLVRRDWCDLSHEVSEYVLAQIFSAESREDAVERIHLYLEKVGQEVRKELIPPAKFVIHKGLTKKPEDYADKDAQPHVQVALRMKGQGLVAKVGDTIPYVICKGPGSSLGKRAFHIDEVTKDGSELQIGTRGGWVIVDLEWYLANQVHPPIARLCAPIEGTDNARLAVCLGLDANKYQHATLSKLEEEELYTLESQLSDHERFKDVVKWTPTCNYCKKANEFVGMVRITAGGVESGFVCPSLDCQRVMSCASLERQLIMAIRSHQSRYLDQSVCCDDPTCQSKSRFVGVFGKKCLVPKCRGLLSLEFSDRSLYTQLQYFEWLFDFDRLISKNRGSQDAIQASLEQYSSHITALSRVVGDYLDTSLRRWVDLGVIFSFGRLSVANEPVSAAA
ncbi:DNA-directed DNA polymerase alpha catalytic subunit pol1 [Kappamyces sp. JEL0680]|nr:DNA-directed DNA polymerase alpha catalytic subunit pol1 [Kappamyces sp. JEL0680]